MREQVMNFQSYTRAFNFASLPTHPIARRFAELGLDMFRLPISTKLYLCVSHVELVQQQSRFCKDWLHLCDTASPLSPSHPPKALRPIMHFQGLLAAARQYLTPPPSTTIHHITSPYHTTRRPQLANDGSHTSIS